MKNINKKIFIIVLSGFVLMTGCNQKEIKEIKDIKYVNEVKEETNKVIDKVNSEIKENNNQIKNVSSEINNNTTKEAPEEKNNNENITVDEQIITYMNDTKESIDTEKIKTTVVKKFIQITDFIFYDSEINGIKFDDLKDETKKEVLDIYGIIDEKIENKFPDYKSTLSEKYKISKTYLKNKYEEISSKVKETIKEKIGEENYNNYSEVGSEAIETGKKAIDTTKEVANDAKEKVKTWYQNLKNKY